MHLYSSCEDHQLPEGVVARQGTNITLAHSLTSTYQSLSLRHTPPLIGHSFSRSLFLRIAHSYYTRLLRRKGHSSPRCALHLAKLDHYVICSSLRLTKLIIWKCLLGHCGSVSAFSSNLDSAHSYQPNKESHVMSLRACIQVIHPIRNQSFLSFSQYAHVSIA